MRKKVPRSEALEHEARELAQAVLRDAEDQWKGHLKVQGETMVSREQDERLAQAEPRGPVTRKRDEFFKELAGCCESLRMVGAAMAWSLMNASLLDFEGDGMGCLWHCLHGLEAPLTALHRERGKRNRSLFPIPSELNSKLHATALRLELKDFCNFCMAEGAGEEAWIFSVICGLNGVAGFGRAPRPGVRTAAQRRAADNVRMGVERMLASDVTLARSPADAEKELAARFISYTGEEVPKMQVIGFEQVKAALPPESHGGSIDAALLVCDGTKRFLNFPEDALLEDPPKDVPLRAKVHVKDDEKLPLAELLVRRRLCVWVEDSDVLRVKGSKVLNGLFAVGKGSTLASGEEVQRLIMNLVPSNGVLKQLQGSTSDLPAITQYLGLVVDDNQQLAFYQSDMSSAFYLFRIPPAWNRMLCFDLCFDGRLLGLSEGSRYYLGCNVIPMGWSSAVSIMQEIADRLTVIGKLPEGHKVRKTAPLPWWLVDVIERGKRSHKAWYHVYLDNFCAMERVNSSEDDLGGRRLHEGIEEAWQRTGVLSSAKKKVVGASKVQELGALLDGENGTIGPSGERLLKLIQSTLVVLGTRRLRKKWVQVLAGRWVHVMSFRRPGMVVFDKVWKFFSLPFALGSLEEKVRGEFVGAILVGMLLHSNLRAGLSPCTSASDASMVGGAVGMSTTLTKAGQEFAKVDEDATGVKRIPILVVSLFNGIGCAFRCYDACGVVPEVCISFEVSREANRVVERRWPHVIIEGDVRKIDEEMIRGWRFKYPWLEAIHIWGGFPCIDLSSVRAYRLNLAGPGSSLFWELVRTIKLIRKTFGFSFPVKYAAENVASMDQQAEEEISKELGVKPWRFDSADVVPIHRPRFCWTNETLKPMEGVEFRETDRWIEIRMWHEYPLTQQWIEHGATWPGEQQNAIFPTAMKSIPRKQPPPKPAGLDRTNFDTRQRWEADSFRYPPYQYHEKFLIWINNKWRLLSAEERELLHGLGFEHTKPCWNANAIKQNPVGYEDCRKSLVGDSFNCFSFAFVAAMLVKPWVTIDNYDTLWGRLGMAPGFCAPLGENLPMERSLRYGNLLAEQGSVDVVQLHRALLRRCNHTGSDIRISSGAIMNPKAFPRQSVNAAWWNWSKVFAFKWLRKDHINALELRSIIHALEWRVFHRKEERLRVFHLTDSYVCMSVVSKGRSSSAMLKPLLQRLGALLLAFDLYLLIGHVESLDNPTDHDSRV